MPASGRGGSQFTHSFIAGEVMATRFSVVKIASTEGQVDLSDSAGEDCIGITQQIAAAGQSVSVCLFGISEAVAGAAITIGDKLQADGSGRVILAASSDNVIGHALQTATAAGDEISMVVNPAGSVLA